MQDPDHKQRRILSLRKNVISIVRKTRNVYSEGNINVRRASRIIHEYVSTYNRTVIEVKNIFLKEYLRHRILLGFSGVLENMR